MLDLRANPFFLNDEDITWVEKTLAGMSLDEKIGQLFLHFGTEDKDLIKNKILSRNVAGMLYRPRKAADLHELHSFIQENAKIPMLLAGNIEDGGIGSGLEGTLFGRAMEVAAANDPIHAYHNGVVSSKEAGALGVNWAFGPVADMDLNYHNPITNIKTYGSDTERVKANAVAFVRGIQENGMAAAPKHFPGEGPDELDQHLVTVVNGLSCEEWDATLGKSFSATFEAGALSVMVGHIALPSYQAKFNPNSMDRVIPATLSKEILTDLLRNQMGFNGVIVTDTTKIGGFRTAMSREQAMPQAVASGCDVVMYSIDFDIDYAYMKKGYEEGIITKERLEEANTRVLAMKAALKLHVKKENGTLVPPLDEAYKVLGNAQHKQWAKECAEASVTLVKDKQNMLPLSVGKAKRILLEFVGDCGNETKDLEIRQLFIKEMETRGYEVTYYDPMNPNFQINDLQYLKEHFDAAIYLGNIETRPDKTTSRINWISSSVSTSLPWFVHDLPTMFISFANPYNLIDVPMMKTYINAYANNEEVIKAVVEKITGLIAFTGVSPVDPFCGRWDTTL